MNHNIRYEARHVDNLDFSIAVHVDTGVPNYEDSLGEDRLTVSAMVYNIELDLWWYYGGGPGNVLHWTKTPPDPGAPLLPGNNHPSNYQWPMTNPIAAFSPHSPFPFNGVYSIKKGEFTLAHDKLKNGGGEEWDVFAGAVIGNLPLGGGRLGYLIYIQGLSPAVLGGKEITEYLQIMPVESNANVVGWNGAPVSVSTSGYPNVNVSDWGGNNAQISKEATANLPNINVSLYNSSPAAISTSGLPQVDVQEYKDATVATMTPGIPEVNVTFVNDSTAAADGLENFGSSGYDIVDQKVLRVAEVELIGANGITSASFDAKCITNNAFDNSAISERVISPATITDQKFDADAIDARVVKDGTITEAKFDNDAISSRVIATDAIDEDAIKIDSVTYEELSDSAIREIVSGVWNASILKPISDVPHSGSTMKPAERGSMGHSMLVDYISNNMLHASDAPGVDWLTPMHTNTIGDTDGEKFYSEELATTPLTLPDGQKAYVDRTAVLLRGLDPNIGEVSTQVTVVLSRLDLGGDGWGGATLEIFNSNDDLVSVQTMTTGFFGTASFEISMGDSYYWVYNGNGATDGEVGFTLSRLDTGDVLAQAIPGSLAGGETDTFTIDARLNQQFLVRIKDVKEDADGQYFELCLVDEDESPVPGGILPTVGSSPGDILVVKAETDTTMHEVAHEVWEESVLDHPTPDTFGLLNRITAGLSQFNHQITDSKYDPSGRLLSCRLVVYSSSDDARNGVNPLTTIEVTSSYDEKQNMIEFVAAEEK